MGADCPVCIPSAILCAKLLDVVPLWCFPCLPWRVQLVQVHWPYPESPTRIATAWSPAGTFVQWSGWYRSEDNDADDGFWNPLLRSVNEYERELVHLPDFLSIHLLFFGRAEVQGSPCIRFSGIMFWCEFSEVLFQEDCGPVLAFFWFQRVLWVVYLPISFRKHIETLPLLGTWTWCHASSK